MKQKTESKRRVPCLRFPEFTDAGEWEERKFRDFVEKSFYGTSDSTSGTGEYPVLRMANMSEGGLDIQSLTYIDLSEEEFKKLQLEKGDILLNRTNSIDLVGKISIFNRQEKFITASYIVTFRLKKKILYPEFCNFLLNSSSYQMQIKSLATRAVSQANINPTAFQDRLNIFVPSIPEQQKIADCLSSLDEIISLESQKLNLLQSYKKGLLQQLFPAEGGAVPQLRFPEFMDTGGWEERKLGEVCDRVGSGVTPLGGESNYKKAGIPFVRSQNVGWGKLLLNDVVYIDRATHQESISTEIALHDVLLNITGASIGRSAIADQRISPGNVNQHVCIIRTQKNNLNPFFLIQYLISDFGQKQIDSFQAGGNRQGLNFAQIRSFVIPVPSLPEQQKIADCLSSIDILISTQSQKLEELRTHKKGLLQGLFPEMGE